MNKIHFFLFAFIAIFFPYKSYSISVSSDVSEFNAKDGYYSKIYKNNTKNTNLYEVKVSKITAPGVSEQELYIHNGEILFTPKKKILFPNEIEYFKFIYNGPRDDKERYYKININELPMLTYEFNSNKKIINFSPSISLDTYLIVKPAIINFDYFYDGLILKNRGNTYFRVIMDTSCSKQNNPHYFYLLPNQEYSGELLKNNGNKYIIYNEKYILIDKKC